MWSFFPAHAYITDRHDGERFAGLLIAGCCSLGLASRGRWPLCRVGCAHGGSCGECRLTALNTDWAQLMHEAVV